MLTRWKQNPMPPKHKILTDILKEAWTPRSTLSTWRWIESNVELDQTSAEPGHVSFDDFPCSKFFFDHFDEQKVKRISLLVSRQSGKTQNLIFSFLKRVKEKPVTTMWVMANADQCEEFSRKRLWPAINSCKSLDKLKPDARDRRTKKIMQFATCNLLLRGSKSGVSLRSDPVGLLYCDERGQWHPGAIEIVRRTTTTFADALEVSAGTPEVKDDELHQDFMAGSQTFIHWNCPHCQHSQPFRFGKDPSVLFPDRRELGGVVWPENDETKPGGRWSYEAVERLAEYECEHCGSRFKWQQRSELLKTAHEVHRNPEALPKLVSMHWNKLYMPWEDCAWGKIAVEFLKAMAAVKCGDIEKLKRLVTEDFGEPWELRSKQKEGELLERRGVYKVGEQWTGDGAALLLTVDRQQTYLVYVLRQWRKDGSSRLIQWGKLPGYEDLRAFQFSNKIMDKAVWGDDGGTDTTNWRQTCLRYGWHSMKGEDFKYYNKSHQNKTWRDGWKETKVDPGIGTSMQGRYQMPLWLFSKDWYREKLYFLFIPGKGPLWEIPSDVDTEYLTQMQAVELREKENAKGEVIKYWNTSGPDHVPDCEMMQLVVADINMLTRGSTNWK